MTAERPLGLEDLRAVAIELAPELRDLPSIAIGWATVDIEAVIRALEADGEPATFEPAPRDEYLGARAVVHRPTRGTAEPIQVLLEPDTESRLAASLARHGEGFVATWFIADGDAGVPRALEARLGTASDGPLGRERPVLGGAATGPHVFVLEGGS
jgi:hypothetical protein